MTTIVTVILNYRTADLSVIAAQAAADAMADFDGAIVIVDNDSEDGSFDKITKEVGEIKWPDNLSVHVLQSGKNGGFGAGNNFGIKAGRALCPQAEFFYILNPDAHAEKQALNALVAHLKATPKAGIAGSWIFGEDGADHCSAFRFPSISSEFEGGIRLGFVTRLLKDSVLPMHIPEKTMPVGWIVGASMLLRAETLDRIGFFDETFFLYFEETDLCLRARNAGIEVHFVRESRVRHIGSVSTGMGTWTTMPAYWYESRWYYFSKNYGRFYALLATLANVFGTAIWRLRRRLEGKPNTDPENYIRRMLQHDLRALFAPIPPEQAHPNVQKFELTAGAES